MRTVIRELLAARSSEIIAKYIIFSAQEHISDELCKYIQQHQQCDWNIVISVSKTEITRLMDAIYANISCTVMNLNIINE